MTSTDGRARATGPDDSIEPAGGLLRIQVLGQFEARLDGRLLNLGGRRQRAVLGVLLLARGQLVPAHRIVEAVWGDEPPPSAAAALQAYVSHLRRRLEPERAARTRAGVIVSEGSGYALRVPADAVDAWRFEDLVRRAARLSDPADRVSALQDALAMWRGPALDEYADEWWAQSEARQLHDLRVLAREQLLAARLDLGESAVLVSELEALIKEEPLREERWRLLVLALYRSNRQADALAALRRARETLVEELGVDPGPALRELEAQVLAQSPALDPGPAPGQQPAQTDPDPTIPGQREPVLPEVEGGTDLVDRVRELTELQRCLDDAMSGQAGLALIEGAAGIGKTRLLNEIRKRAPRQGATVLSARGSVLEKEYGFGVVRQLFDPLVVDAGRRDELFHGAAASALGVFDAASAEPHQRIEGMFAVLHGLYWMTVNLASAGPVVLAIDDLQWCDNGSLRYLAYLVRRLEGMNVLVVATFRTGEHYDDEELLAELSTDPITVPIHPEPLTITGVGDLVRERLGRDADDAFVRTCHRTTSGNPLLLRQLLRALEAEKVRPDASHADTVRAIGSRAVSSMVLMRFARMPAANRAVARAVAVLGDGASLPMVAAHTGLTDEEAARAIAGLARAEVLRDDLPLGFVHPLVGDAVYGDIPAGERELLHERAARVLGAASATPEQIAAHLLLVAHRGDGGVVRVLREAAARDVDRGSAESARSYLRRAVQEPPPEELRPQVLLELGRVETLSDGPSAVEHLRAAYRALPDPEQRADAAILLVRTLVFAGERGEATDVARHAIADLPPKLDDQRQALESLCRIGGYMHALDPEVYDATTRPVLSGTGPGARGLAATLAWEYLIAGEHRDRAVELARFALEDGILQTVDSGLLWVVAGIVLDMADEDSLPFWEEALADAHARGALFAALGAHLWGGYCRWGRGDLREAYQSFVNCTEQNQIWGANDVGQPYTDAFMIGVRLDQGDVAGARALIDGTRSRLRLGDGIRLFGEAEAMVLLAEGRPAEALATLESVQHLMATTHNPVWRPWRSLRAKVLAELGRREDAVRLVTDELGLARRWGTATLVGKTLRLLGELKGAEGVEDLREAVRLLDPTLARLERARAWAGLGRALAVNHPGVDAPAEAMAAFQTALELVEPTGALGLRAELAAELVRGGVVVPEQPDGATWLTGTERRIAAMAIEGSPGREIAQALFITPHAVQVTLESVLSRLGATSVSELRTALVDA